MCLGPDSIMALELDPLDKGAKHPNTVLRIVSIFGFGLRAYINVPGPFRDRNAAYVGFLCVEYLGSRWAT